MWAKIASKKLSSILLLCILSIVVKAQYTVNFKVSSVNGCAPLIVYFKDASTNNPTKWKWDLGNGTISFLQNPSATYFNAGLYTIKLITSNSNGSDSIIKKNYINVSSQPVVQFTSSTTSGCFPLPVQFTDKSSAEYGIINLWQWDFGDGLSSALQHPLHTYKDAGNYNVTLRIKNSGGCITTFSKSKYIQITSGTIADFSNSYPDNCSLPVAVNFTNLSTGSGTLSYQWFFGDGTTSNQTNPSHIYTALGNYTLKLVVKNSSGCTDTIIKSSAIKISKIKASFTNTDKVCTQKEFLLTNTSIPAPLSNKWSFGDGTTSTENNPVKIYNTPGVYKITLISNFSSCADTAFKTITVNAQPISSFTSDTSISCTYPFSVNFINQSLKGTIYHWDFGDSTTSTSANPTHIYTSGGNFNVQLVTTNESGCNDTLTKTSFIKIQRPVVMITSLRDSGCVSFVKKFTSNVQSVNAVKDYLWNFGDGTTSTEISPTHIYNLSGAYSVSLIVKNIEGCQDTAILNRAVVASVNPIVNFDATPKLACANTAVVFTDLTANGGTKWLWKFGDGFKSPLQNPYHMYADSGLFTVKLIVWNSGCVDSISYKNFIYINPPVGEYTYYEDCANPYKKDFKDISIGADRWSWNFGDGVTSTLQNPTHTFIKTGTYQVVQIVWNNKSGCNYVNKKNVIILDTKANFTKSDSMICKGGSIIFKSSLSAPEVNSFNWNFGDGTIVDTTTNTLTHNYNTAGNYNVTLITTNFFGCTDTLNKITKIIVNGPTAKFNSSLPGSCLNSTIIFNDLSISDGINPIKSYLWSYGDSTTQTNIAGPFQHQYIKSGLYNVKLLLTDKIGCTDNFSLPNPLVISKPIASFNTSETITCPTKTVAFNNTSTGPNLTYLWAFGDNNTSLQKDPLHLFAAEGKFNISLNITDQYGCTDSITKLNYVTILLPVAEFKMSDSLSNCPPLIVQFTNMATNAVSINWDFGDETSSKENSPSHFYSYPGTYVVQLTATGPGGCVSIKKDSINIKGPTGNFSYNILKGCDPVIINFVANTSEITSIVWDMNDGTTVSTGNLTISHNYINPGFYLPKIILSNKDGCAVPIKGLDTISIYGVTARFDFLEKTLCDSGTVFFRNFSTSNDVITNYDWALGDGSISDSKTPQHKYKFNGSYNTFLKVTTQFGCIDSTDAAIPIKVVSSPHINFTTTANGCTPLFMSVNGSANLDDKSSLKWQWNFGNGTFSSLQNPEIQKYTTKGVYTIGLLATNSSGCTDSVSKTIEAYGLPVLVTTQNTFICENQGINLMVKGAIAYNWSPSIGLSCTTCAYPFAKPDSSLNYIVKGTGEHGCIAFDSVILVVKHPFKIIYSTRDTLCKTQSATLFARGASTYIWSPSTGLNNPTSATPIAQPNVSTNYKVVGTDDRGCFKDSGFIFIKVYPIPEVNAGVDATINVGQSYNLLPKISADVTEVLWSPTSGIFRNSYPGITVKPIENTEYTVLVKNEGGCTAQDKINVFVICNGANIFVPNTFSPNGDGANDIFYPRGTGVFKIQSIQIFNRWGQMVFEKNDFNANDVNAGWNGTFKGVKLNPDVFVYTMNVICDNNSILSYKGNITLIQ